MILLLSIVLTYHFFNFLTFMMVLELSEIFLILALFSFCSGSGISSLFMFVGILIIISFAICALTLLVSSFSGQGFMNFMFHS